jgi:addiction module RelB/DinJ family antitoxin
MTELLRVRVEKSLLKEAEAVSEELGTTAQEAVRLFLTQLVKRRGIPFALTAEAPVEGLVDVARRNRIWSELDDAAGW